MRQFSKLGPSHSEFPLPQLVLRIDDHRPTTTTGNSLSDVVVDDDGAPPSKSESSLFSDIDRAPTSKSSDVVRSPTSKSSDIVRSPTSSKSEPSLSSDIERVLSKPPTTAQNSQNNSRPKKLYRIGDGVGFFRGAPGCREYPASIVCAYQRLTRTPNSIPDLLKVLDARSNQSEIPDPLAAVIHVRLGDGLCADVDRWRCRRVSRGPSDCWNDIHDCHTSNAAPHIRYAYPKEYYVQLVQELDVGRLIIMGNFNHWQGPKRNGTTADERYVSHMMKFFKSRGFDVELRIDKEPDVDFMYACAARTFVRGGGGFSGLIAQVVQARGGRVLPTETNQSLFFDQRPYRIKKEEAKEG